MKVKAWCRRRHLMKIKDFDSNTSKVSKPNYDKTIDFNLNDEIKF